MERCALSPCGEYKGEDVTGSQPCSVRLGGTGLMSLHLFRFLTPRVYRRNARFLGLNYNSPTEVEKAGESSSETDTRERLRG